MSNSKLSMLWLTIDLVESEIHYKESLIDDCKLIEGYQQGIETLISDIKELRLIKDDLQSQIK